MDSFDFDVTPQSSPRQEKMNTEANAIWHQMYEDERRMEYELFGDSASDVGIRNSEVNARDTDSDSQVLNKGLKLANALNKTNGSRGWRPKRTGTKASIMTKDESFDLAKELQEIENIKSEEKSEGKFDDVESANGRRSSIESKLSNGSKRSSRPARKLSEHSNRGKKEPLDAGTRTTNESRPDFKKIQSMLPGSLYDLDPSEDAEPARYETREKGSRRQSRTSQGSEAKSAPQRENLKEPTGNALLLSQTLTANSPEKTFDKNVEDSKRENLTKTQATASTSQKERMKLERASSHLSQRERLKALRAEFEKRKGMLLKRGSVVGFPRSHSNVRMKKPKAFRRQSAHPVFRFNSYRKTPSSPQKIEKTPTRDSIPRAESKTSTRSIKIHADMSSSVKQIPKSLPRQASMPMHATLADSKISVSDASRVVEVDQKFEQKVLQNQISRGPSQFQYSSFNHSAKSDSLQNISRSHTVEEIKDIPQTINSLTKDTWNQSEEAESDDEDLAGLLNSPEMRKEMNKLTSISYKPSRRKLAFPEKEEESKESLPNLPLHHVVGCTSGRNLMATCKDGYLFAAGSIPVFAQKRPPNLSTVCPLEQTFLLPPKHYSSPQFASKSFCAGRVTSVTVDATGQIAAVAQEGREQTSWINIWKLESGSRLASLHTRISQVYAITFQLNEDIVIVGGVGRNGLVAYYGWRWSSNTVVFFSSTPGPGDGDIMGMDISFVAHVLMSDNGGSEGTYTPRTEESSRVNASDFVYLSLCWTTTSISLDFIGFKVSSSHTLRISSIILKSSNLKLSPTITSATLVAELSKIVVGTSTGDVSVVDANAGMEINHSTSLRQRISVLTSGLSSSGEILIFCATLSSRLFTLSQDLTVISEIDLNRFLTLPEILWRPDHLKKTIPGYQNMQVNGIYADDSCYELLLSTRANQIIKVDLRKEIHEIISCGLPNASSHLVAQTDGSLMFAACNGEDIKQPAALFVWDVINNAHSLPHTILVSSAVTSVQLLPCISSGMATSTLAIGLANGGIIALDILENHNKSPTIIMRVEAAKVLSGAVSSISLSPDVSSFCVGSNKGELALVNIGKQGSRDVHVFWLRRTWAGKRLLNIDFDEKGHYIRTLSYQNLIEFWDAKTRQPTSKSTIYAAGVKWISNTCTLSAVATLALHRQKKRNVADLMSTKRAGNLTVYSPVSRVVNTCVASTQGMFAASDEQGAIHIFCSTALEIDTWSVVASTPRNPHTDTAISSGDSKGVRFADTDESLLQEAEGTQIAFTARDLIVASTFSQDSYILLWNVQSHGFQNEAEETNDHGGARNKPAMRDIVAEISSSSDESIAENESLYPSTASDRPEDIKDNGIDLLHKDSKENHDYHSTQVLQLPTTFKAHMNSVRIARGKWDRTNPQTGQLWDVRSHPLYPKSSSKQHLQLGHKQFLQLVDLMKRRLQFLKREEKELKAQIIIEQNRQKKLQKFLSRMRRLSSKKSITNREKFQTKEAHRKLFAQRSMLEKSNSQKEICRLKIRLFEKNRKLMEECRTLSKLSILKNSKSREKNRDKVREKNSSRKEVLR